VRAVRAGHPVRASDAVYKPQKVAYLGTHIPPEEKRWIPVYYRQRSGGSRFRPCSDPPHGGGRRGGSGSLVRPILRRRVFGREPHSPRGWGGRGSPAGHLLPTVAHGLPL